MQIGQREERGGGGGGEGSGRGGGEGGEKRGEVVGEFSRSVSVGSRNPLGRSREKVEVSMDIQITVDDSSIRHISRSSPNSSPTASATFAAPSTPSTPSITIARKTNSKTSPTKNPSTNSRNNSYADSRTAGATGAAGPESRATGSSHPHSYSDDSFLLSASMPVAFGGPDHLKETASSGIRQFSN